MPAIFIFCIASAAICGSIAHSQRRSIGLAVLIGFLLPLISILIYAFVTESKRICPKCGEPNAATRHHCKVCDAALT